MFCAASCDDWIKGKAGMSSTLGVNNRRHDTAEQIYEKTRSLPSDKQNEALRFVDFLLARRSAEAAEWRKLLRETQSSYGVANVTDDDVGREVTAVRNNGPTSSNACVGAPVPYSTASFS
jgi:ABC-type molybdate transport system substrate-binding protein